jgi:hypothetical protein
LPGKASYFEKPPSGPAAALGKRGGEPRPASLAPEQWSEIARGAAEAMGRWPAFRRIIIVANRAQFDIEKLDDPWEANWRFF